MLIPRSLLRTKVLIQPNLGNTGDGVAYGDPVPAMAEYDASEKIVRGPTGDARVIAGTLNLLPDETIKAGDRVVVLDTTYAVESVKPVPGPGGRIMHQEVRLR